MITARIAGSVVHVPEIEAIPVPKSRKATKRALDANADTRAARDAVNAADKECVAVRERAERAAQNFYEKGGSRPDPTADFAAADTALEAARIDFTGATHAELKALTRMREAYVAEVTDWAAVAVSEAEKSIAIAATALDFALEAREALLSSVGVLGMLNRLQDEPSAAALAIQHRPQGFIFDIEPAIAGLEATISNATDELELRRAALLPAKRKRGGKKAAASIDEAANTSTPQGLTIDDGDIEVGEDDDD